MTAKCLAQHFNFAVCHIKWKSFPLSNRLRSLSTTASWTWCSSSSPSSGKSFLTCQHIYRRYSVVAADPRGCSLGFTSQRLFAQLGHNLNSLSYSRWQQPQARLFTPSSSGDLLHLLNSNRKSVEATPRCEKREIMIKKCFI